MSHPPTPAPVPGPVTPMTELWASQRYACPVCPVCPAAFPTLHEKKAHVRTHKEVQQRA